MKGENMTIESTLERIALGIETILLRMDGNTLGQDIEKVHNYIINMEPKEEVVEPTKEVYPAGTIIHKAVVNGEGEIALEVTLPKIGKDARQLLETALRANVAKLGGPEWALNLLAEFGANKLSEVKDEDVLAIGVLLEAKNDE